MQRVLSFHVGFTTKYSLRDPAQRVQSGARLVGLPRARNPLNEKSGQTTHLVCCLSCETQANSCCDANELFRIVIEEKLTILVQHELGNIVQPRIRG